MKKIFCFLFIILLFHNFAGAQWIQQVSGVSAPLLDADFINSQTGWVCGDFGTILKTTNGGINWFQQNSGVTKRLEGIEAVDANTLYCVGWFQTILKSTNGGGNWQILRNGQISVDPTFFKCYFINNNTGWLLRNGGSGGYILRTTNGGNSFDSTNVIFSFLKDIYFKDALTGILCGNGALIMRSTNGGVNWSQITIPLHNGGLPNLYRLSFVGNNGWTVGEGSSGGLGKLVYRTTNFGLSWDTIGRAPYPDGELNYSVFFPSLNTGYCGGTTGYTFKTTNGGFNWIQQAVPINGYRGDLWFANDSLGWAVGGGGYILNTTNGGTYVGIEPITNNVPERFELEQNYPNPYNPVTIIHFAIKESDTYKLEVYDILGRKVDLIFNNYLTAGYYQASYNAPSLSSGIYIYRLSSAKHSASKKMIFLK